MSWYRWKWWRLAYAPWQSGVIHAHGLIWKPTLFGFYIGAQLSKDTPA